MLGFLIRLTNEERRALWELARLDRRDPREQAALIIRRALERQGLLPKKGNALRFGPIEEASRMVESIGTLPSKMVDDLKVEDTG